MTKFGESKKIGLSDLLFQNIQFRQFQSKIKEGARLEDLKIQCVLKHGKGLKCIKEPRWKKSKSEAEAQEPDYPILDNGVSGFSRTDRVWLRFEI
jgi:hypothetical protein